MQNYKKEFGLIGIIAFLLSIHFLGLLDDSMMFSGIICLAIIGYIAVLFQESILDERDEYIRNKTNRYLYILTIGLLLSVIVYKTFAHQNYSLDLLLLTTISIAKLLMNKFLNLKN